VQNLDDERAGLACMDSVTRDVAAVVVHERDHADAAVLALQYERKQIGLPHCIGLRPFEAVNCRRVRLCRRLLGLVGAKRNC